MSNLSVLPQAAMSIGVRQFHQEHVRYFRGVDAEPAAAFDAMLALAFDVTLTLGGRSVKAPIQLPAQERQDEPMIGSRPLLLITAVAEAVTGFLLVIDPPLVIRLLLGPPPEGPETLARICGFALVSLAAACWPRRHANLEQQCLSMLLYNASAGALLALAGVAGSASGVLLWPAAAFHILMAVLLALTLRKADSEARSAR